MSELSVAMPKVVAHAAIRHLRKCRDHLKQDRDVLFHQHERRGDVDTANAIMALDNEIYLVEEAIAILWRAYNAQP